MWNPVIALHHCAVERGNSGRVAGNPYLGITSGLSVMHPRSDDARIGDYIVRTARNRALPSATRS